MHTQSINYFEVMNLLDSNSVKGTDLLIEFARRHSSDRALYKRAVLLKSRFNMVTSESERLNVMQEMKSLAVQINTTPAKVIGENPAADATKRYFLETRLGYD